MKKQRLEQWAKRHDDGATFASDYKMSLTSKLVRFRWEGVPAVAVSADVADTKTRINAVLDGLAWYLNTHKASDDTLHVLLGVPECDTAKSLFREHCDAVGTLAASVANGPTIKLWALDDDGSTTPIPTEPATFNSVSPTKWATMLKAAAVLPVEGKAKELVTKVSHPSFALYPKLSSVNSKTPWQLRLDGIEIGRAGRDRVTLNLNSTAINKPGEPRDTWRKVVGDTPITTDNASLDDVAALVNALIAAWTTSHAAAVLAHGQAEHALEAHLLSGRIAIETSSGPLHLAIPSDDRALRTAQFPTLWGDAIRPARYLDALLADEQGRPWAIELKDQDAGGGHGSYLRHGIGQAVLYRHYIRTAPGLDDYFEDHKLDRKLCQSAVAYPAPPPGAVSTTDSHKALAAMFNVEMIECQGTVVSARGRSLVVPVGGHRNCPLMASSSARG